MKTQKRTFSAIQALLMLCLLLSAATASAERSKVAFQHVRDKTLKTDCVEIKGKHDVVPHYTCYDDEGLAQPITPDTEWRLVEAEKVCFIHRVRDTIRVCMEITPLMENGSSCYTCKIGDEAPKSFDPTAKWEKLSADDKRCAPRLQSFEVSRTMVIQGLPDWGGNDAKQE
ncbi:hypothetical protein VU11_03060 [Desulfobulbus sp. US2]|nr:hypothetical protein [Desulfobulbus sp. US4]MCW5207640.1 hypothetical protein [Desulfobulbus sp. US2]